MKKSMMVVAISCTVLTVTSCGRIQMPWNDSANPAHSVGGATMPTLQPAVSEEIAWVQDYSANVEQSLQIIHMATTQTSNVAVLDIAKQVSFSQQFSSRVLTGWLETWGSGNGTPKPLLGALTSTQLDNLMASRDAAFDSTWIQVMIAHHQGALACATSFKDHTKNTQILKFIRTQEQMLTAQIGQLQDLQLTP